MLSILPFEAEFFQKYDIKIEYIGLRPGEKLYEELITKDEGFVSTGHEKILVIKGIKRNPEILNAEIDQLVRLAKEQNQENIKTKLKKIVPEYKPAVQSKGLNEKPKLFKNWKITK